MIFTGRNKVTSPYGTRTLNGKTGFHGGIDIVGMDDKKVHAVKSGTVIVKGKWNGYSKTGLQSYGNYVVVQTDGGYLHYYAHLDRFAPGVELNKHINRGDVLGIMGNTGNTTGPHTHFEVRKNNQKYNPAFEAGVENKKGVYTEPRGVEYYPAYHGKSSSIVDALQAIGQQSGYAHRKHIAYINGIEGYRGTPEQNTQLLNLLKAGKLIKNKAEAPTVSQKEDSVYYPKYTGSTTSIVNALHAIGEDYSYTHRKRIAAANGLTGYAGLPWQNTKLLNLLKSGRLKKAK